MRDVLPELLIAIHFCACFYFWIQSTGEKWIYIWVNRCTW